MTKEYSERRIELKEISDYYTIRAEKYRALGEILQTKHTFFVTGFIPKKEIESLRMNLENDYTVAIDVEAPKDNEDVPVLLSNSKTAGAVEGVVTSFGYPTKTEIDPTLITAFFYYFFFGIMLSDAAYGLFMGA